MYFYCKVEGGGIICNRVFPTPQVTWTSKCLLVPMHGSLKTPLLATIEHDALLIQAVDTTEEEDVAWHEEVAYVPHEPVGVP